MKRRFVKFSTNESGATAAEYGLIAAGIALAIIPVANELGSKLNAILASIDISVKQSSTRQIFIPQVHEHMERPNSLSVWETHVVADENANEVRPPLLGSLKRDQLPK